MAAGRLWMAGANLDWDGASWTRAATASAAARRIPSNESDTGSTRSSAAAGEARSPAARARGDARRRERGREAHERIDACRSRTATSAPRTDVTARLQALFSELSGLQESELRCQRLLPRARPRLALPHSGEHGDSQDLRGQGRIPRSPRGRFDAGTPSPPGSRPSYRPKLHRRYRRSHAQAATASSADAAATAADPLERSRGADGGDGASARDASRSERRRTATPAASGCRDPRAIPGNDTAAHIRDPCG